RLLQARLLPLDLARVAGQETGLLEVDAQRFVRLQQRPRDAVAQRAGLAGDAAAVDPCPHVEAGLRAAHLQRRGCDRPQRGAWEVLRQRLAVDGDLTGSGDEHDARDRGLALARSTV